MLFMNVMLMNTMLLPATLTSIILLFVTWIIAILFNAKLITYIDNLSSLDTILIAIM